MSPPEVPSVADYRTLNQANWDERAAIHGDSSFYGTDRYVRDPDLVSDVVQFDRPLLGDLTGVRGVHLQCHLGTDTLSLARLGAVMSGLDFSAASLERARALAGAAGMQIDYHQADVYEAADVLGRSSFDLVYTGVGALCWLPRMKDWADTVAALLRPGGRLFIREGHPVLWALADPRPDRALALEYPYFEVTEPQVWDEPTSYTDSDRSLTASVTHQWNHGLADIVGSLLDAGMQLTGLVEHQSVPWEALPGQMRQLHNGEWQLDDRPERLPHSYTLQAVRPR